MTGGWRKVSDIFSAALEQPTAERIGFVARACADDAALLAEVTELLAIHGKAGDFLERPATADVGPEPAEANVRPGQSLGPYRIDDVLGEGGMGIVLLATDTRLKRKVALKALAPALANDSSHRERQIREARMAAALSHPNVATVYALEEIDGQAFIASEYVEGPTLRHALASGPFGAAELISAGRQMARALSAAHAKGIVHRDLKPENVIRTADGTLKVLDFGIARMPMAPGGGERLTRAGAILGTTAYMSPEQLEGPDVDIRSDVFSFGVVMYELASGCNPFASAMPIATAARVIAADPPPLTSAASALPPGLDRIIRRCLEKDRRQRYASPDELLADLDALPGAVAPRSRPAAASVIPGARGWWRLHQSLAMATYAALVYPVWQAKWWNEGPLNWSLLLLMIVAAAFNGTLRAHWLFTAHFNPAEISTELRRAGSWVRASDLGISLVLVATAIGLLGTHMAAGVTLAAFGVGVAAVSMVVEPATTRAAFPRE